MTARIVFIGCVDFSRRLLLASFDAGANIVGVVSRESAPGNSDFVCLDQVAAARKVPVHLTKNANAPTTIQWIKDRSPDVIFCFGWSQLLKAELLEASSMGVIGYHPALLPQNRGRHPIIWALTLGLSETGSSFFVMDQGADSGDIVSQRPVEIDEQDDSRALYERLARTASEQLEEIVSRINSGTLVGTPQEHEKANSWRKRNAVDGQIDWRMPAKGIVNLVRALRPPYPGATIHYDGEARRIWLARPFEGSVPENAEPGRVLAVTGRELLVKAGSGAVRVLEHELDFIPDVGDYL